MVNYFTGETLSADCVAFLHADRDLDEQDSCRTPGLDYRRSDGVRIHVGTLNEWDALIYGTGFKASRFLWPFALIDCGQQTREPGPSDYEFVA